MLDETRQVLWNQGLFLQPHHFQTSDLASDARIRSLRRFSDPWPWGFQSLTLSSGALENNQVHITEFHGVFQDGSELAFPGNAVVAPRSFAGVWTDPERPFTIYLGLRRHDPNGSNVTVEEKGTIRESNEKLNYSLTRYCAYHDETQQADLHGDGPAEAVQTLYYAPHIFWESEIGDMADCDFMPLARLVRKGESVVQDVRFVPPPLCLESFDYIKGIVQDIHDQLLGRTANLEEYKPADGDSDNWLEDPKAFGMLLVLMLLNRNIPPFDFALETAGTRPWAAYLSICQLVGELSSVVSGITAQGGSEFGERLLPAYDHADCGPCFVAARNLVYTMLSRVASGPEHMVRMEPSEGVLSATPPDNFYSTEFRHYLLLRSSLKPEAIREEVMRYGKLCPRKLLHDIITKALPGIELRPLDTAPTGLPRRTDTAFFEINGSSPLWRSLHTSADKGLSFSWDGGGDDVVVHLAAMR